MRSKLFGSIRVRIVSIYLLITVAAFSVISIIVAGMVETSLVSQRTKTQLRDTTRLALEIAPNIYSYSADELYSFVRERAQSMGGRILILDADAVVQVDSASQHNGFMLPLREIRDVLTGGKSESYGFHNIDRTQNITGMLSLDEESVWAVYYTAPVTLNGVYVGAVLFSSLIQDVETSVNDLVKQMVLIFVAVAGITAISTFMLSGWLTKPIVALTAAIRRMGRKGYGVKVKVTGGGEIAELGTAFNRMSEQIEIHDRVRDEFIANASHELKTPLSTMKVLSESILYQDEPDPGLMREFFADVNSEVDRLTRVITELLRLVQEDTSESELKLETVRLDELVAGTVERLRPLAQKKGVGLNAKLEPVSAKLEPVRIEQVAVNLIENAIKYTDSGNVNIIVRQEHQTALLIVRDTGIGIPEEALPHLFERFYRVDKARSRSTGGTGLGLSIVEDIIELHGGEIKVQSTLGIGSTFTVMLPIHHDDRQADGRI